MAAKKKAPAKPQHEDVPPPPTYTRPPTNYELIFGESYTPLDRLRIWDEDRFEAYVHEWLYAMKRAGKYGKIVWSPGSGDKGRDVRAYVTDEQGEWDNYQCKHYKNALTPGDAWLELAKLCLYTFQKVFRKPRKYYFVAPFDLGPDLSTLVESPEKFNALLIKEWEKDSKGGIASKLVPLDAALRKSVEEFDFRIVTFKPQREIVEEIEDTEFYKRTFGCGGLVRPPLDPIPDAPAPEEGNYVQALRVAFAEFLGVEAEDATDEVIGGNPALNRFYKVSRECFYKAEQLYRFGRDTFPTSHCFEDLQEQVYVGILAAASSRYDHGFAKAMAVTAEAGKLQLGNHFLVGLKLVEVRDCHGICHQIVNSNDGRLDWAVKPKEAANA